MVTKNGYNLVHWHLTDIIIFIISCDAYQTQTWKENRGNCTSKEKKKKLKEDIWTGLQN